MECKYCGVEHPKKEKNNPFFCMEQMSMDIAALQSYLNRTKTGYDEYVYRTEHSQAVLSETNAQLEDRVKELEDALRWLVDEAETCENCYEESQKAKRLLEKEN